MRVGIVGTPIGTITLSCAYRTNLALMSSRYALHLPECKCWAINCFELHNQYDFFLKTAYRYKCQSNVDRIVNWELTVNSTCKYRCSLRLLLFYIHSTLKHLNYLIWTNCLSLERFKTPASIFDHCYDKTRLQWQFFSSEINFLIYVRSAK